MNIDQNLKAGILRMQANEITEHIIYKKLAQLAPGSNSKLLEKISREELSHYNFWKKFTSQDAKPLQLKISFYYFTAKFLGLNFGLRLMEKGEESAQDVYGRLKKLNPKVNGIISEERQHEEMLLDLLDKNELLYTSSIILGLNDALVELTGALAGFTLALPNTRIIAVVGLITGIAASLSMAGSEYLSTKEEGTKNPLKASIYTGIAYTIAVMLLIAPYFVFSLPLVSLAFTLATALLIIFIFNFYISVAKNLSFKKRFMEMAAISMGIAMFGFFVGLAIKNLLNVQI